MPPRCPRRNARQFSKLLVTAVLLLAILVLSPLAAAPGAHASTVQVDDEVPPGNPVVGSDAPGDTPPGGTNYLLLVVLGAGLVLGGFGLIRLERWERDRTHR